MRAEKYKVINGQPIPVTERKCSNCNGAFDCTPEWQYKHLNAYCCSYECMQAVRKRAEEKKLQKIAERAAARKTKHIHLKDTEVVNTQNTEGITPEQEELVLIMAEQIRQQQKVQLPDEMVETIEKTMPEEEKAVETVETVELDGTEYHPVHAVQDDVTCVPEQAAVPEVEAVSPAAQPVDVPAAMSDQERDYMARMVEARLRTVVKEIIDLDELLFMVDLWRKLRAGA